MKLVGPGLGEVGPVGDHEATERSLVVGEVVAAPERLAEHEEYLVAVQDAHPARPRVGAVALGEEVRVHGQAERRVAPPELVQRTHELAVAGRHVERVDVPVVVLRVQPVRVLELRDNETQV